MIVAILEFSIGGLTVMIWLISLMTKKIGFLKAAALLNLMANGGFIGFITWETLNKLKEKNKPYGFYMLALHGFSSAIDLSVITEHVLGIENNDYELVPDKGH